MSVDAEQGTAPDTGPLPEAAIPILAEALQRATGRAFKLANRAGQEARGDRMWALSMSGLGGCPRQAAYRLAGVAPSDPALAYDQEARPAMIGTWIHAGLLPALGDVLHHADIELPLELRVPVFKPDGDYAQDLVITGTTDCYSQVMGGGILDLKTLAAYKLGDIDHDGVKDRHRKQVRGYATAARQMGLPVAWVAWLYLDRATGEELVHLEAFDEEAEADTEELVQWLWSWTQAPDYAPRGERGPGLSWECDGCPWLRQCWGPEAEAGDKSAIQVHDRDDIALAAEKYKELSAQIRALEKEQEVYGAMVGRPMPGTYGDMKITYQKDGEEVDQRATKEALVLLGGEIPMRPRRGNRLINWAVKKKRG